MDKESVDNDSVDIIQVNSEEEPHSLPAISLSETTLATAATPFFRAVKSGQGKTSENIKV